MSIKNKTTTAVKVAAPNRYVAILSAIFDTKYRRGNSSVEFTRQDIADAAKELGVELPKNLGDLVYTFRYRVDLPLAIKARAG